MKIIMAALMTSGMLTGAHAQTSVDRVAYLEAAVTSALAENVCRGYRADVSRVLELRERVAKTTADEDMLNQQIDVLRRATEKAYEQYGNAVWCGMAWSRLGPLGTLAPGVLRRR